MALGAINRDYYAYDFVQQLDALDKNKAYLLWGLELADHDTQCVAIVTPPPSFLLTL